MKFKKGFLGVLIPLIILVVSLLVFFYVYPVLSLGISLFDGQGLDPFTMLVIYTSPFWILAIVIWWIYWRSL